MTPSRETVGLNGLKYTVYLTDGYIKSIYLNGKLIENERIFLKIQKLIRKDVDNGTDEKTV